KDWSSFLVLGAGAAMMACWLHKSLGLALRAEGTCV
ncbi:unnamed protein product, partial [Prunus brigantina]